MDSYSPVAAVEMYMSIAELRERTGPLHARLDARLQLFTHVQTREQYREHLHRFYQILRPVEAALEQFPEWKKFGIDWSERRKSALLQADLAALGLSPETIANSRPAAELPPVKNFAESVGSLYVLEGSTLGAQFIAKHFGEKFGLTADTGMSFHTGYGANTGAKWKSFCAALEAFFLAHPELRSQALDSACAAFTAVENTLCEPHQ